MMKKNKKLQEKIDKLVIGSFASDGSIKEDKVKRAVGVFKILPRQEAIFALSWYLKMIKVQIQKNTLEIESAVSLSTDQVKQISGQVKKDYPHYFVETKINPSLLGGLRVKMNDCVFDNSVRRKIGMVKGVIYG